MPGELIPGSDSSGLQAQIDSIQSQVESLSGGSSEPPTFVSTQVTNSDGNNQCNFTLPSTVQAGDALIASGGGNASGGMTSVTGATPAVAWNLLGISSTGNHTSTLWLATASSTSASKTVTMQFAGSINCGYLTVVRGWSRLVASSTNATSSGVAALNSSVMYNLDSTTLLIGHASWRNSGFTLSTPQALNKESSGNNGLNIAYALFAGTLSQDTAFRATASGSAECAVAAVVLGA